MGLKFQAYIRSSHFKMVRQGVLLKCTLYTLCAILDAVYEFQNSLFSLLLLEKKKSIPLFDRDFALR